MNEKKPAPLPGIDMVDALTRLGSNRALLERVYVEGADATPGVPTEGVPKLLKRALPIQEIVKVDVHVPGCPPPASTIVFVLTELLEGRMPDLDSRIKFG